MKSLSAVPALLVSCTLAVGADQDWPGLRGPRHDGGASGTLEGADGAAFAVAWRAALGAGYSSVAVLGGRAITLLSDGQNDVAVAFDSGTGRELWRSVIAPTLRGKDGSYDGPIATPALADGRVFGLGPRGHLFALDAASGRELWKVDLVEREGALAPHYGFTASPIVAGGVLVVPLGAKDGGAFAGFDLASGARRFRLGDDSVAYQTPIVVSVGGRELVLAVGDTKLFGIDPARPLALRACPRRRDSPARQRERGAGARGRRPHLSQVPPGRLHDVPAGARARRQGQGRDALDGARAALDLRRARLPRRVPLRHERPGDAHLRGRGHGPCAGARASRGTASPCSWGATSWC